MRLHGLIFAAGQGVPLVGIVYDQKVSSFLSYIGQDLYEDLNRLTADKLKSLIDGAVSRERTRRFCLKAWKNCAGWMKSTERSWRSTPPRKRIRLNKREAFAPFRANAFSLLSEEIKIARAEMRSVLVTFITSKVPSVHRPPNPPKPLAFPPHLPGPGKTRPGRNPTPSLPKRGRYADPL